MKVVILNFEQSKFLTFRGSTDQDMTTAVYNVSLGLFENRSLRIYSLNIRHDDSTT